MAKRLPQTLLAAMCVVALLAVPGCGYKATFDLGYLPQPLAEPPPGSLAIAVKQLTDNRAPRRWSSSQGRMFLTYVPLIPFVEIPFERVDESLEKIGVAGLLPDAGLPRQVSQALVRDLVKSGIAKKSFLVREGIESPPAHLLLTGELLSTKHTQYATSYMLGIFGVYLWLLPIPVGSTVADIEARISLSDPNGNEVWRCSVEGTSRAITTLYNSANGARTDPQLRMQTHHFGENTKGIDPNSLWAFHSDAMRSGMKPCRASMAEFLATYEAMEAASFTTPASTSDTDGLADRLRRLRSLFDQGLISIDEYERRRGEILDGI